MGSACDTGAIEVLKAQDFDRDQAKMLLLQVRAMDPSAQDPIDSFVQSMQDPKFNPYCRVTDMHYVADMHYFYVYC